MSRNAISIPASPDQVFAVLDDADAYPRWVVGARRIRHVDANWPAPGSEFDHEVGTAAASLQDDSQVVDREWPRRLELEVRFRPIGVARVTLSVSPEADGSTVVMEEATRWGPADWLPGKVVDPLLHVRNAWSLRRLRDEVERRVGEVTKP
jgi:uncharacterized protein YndB with AHSA1/START domain